MIRYWRYLVVVTVAALTIAWATSCATSNPETVTLAQSRLPTPDVSATRIPRAVATTLPRLTPLPYQSPAAPLYTTPQRTITSTPVLTATTTPTIWPTTTGTPAVTVTTTAVGSPAASPTPTPTPGATTTGVPTPSRQVLSAAASLAQKIDAFREAVKKNDTNAMLRTQRELLDEADRAEAAVKDDRSRYAENLRSAIKSIREGSSGEMGKLDAAGRDLREAVGKQEGEESSPDQGTRTPSVSPSEMRSMAEALSRKIESFGDALSSRNPENALRQQKDLLDEMNRVEHAVKTDRSKQGEQIRSALDSIRNALGGDRSKLDEAQRALEKAIEGQE